MTVDDLGKLLAHGGTIYFVGAGGSDVSDGLTWATRKLTFAAVVSVAVDDDTVVLGKATFPERINTTKRLHLIGASRTGTIFTGSGTSPTAKLGAGSTIRNVKVDPAGGDAVTFEATNGVRVANCHFKNSAVGGKAYSTVGIINDVVEDTILDGAIAMDNDSSTIMCFRTNFIGAVNGSPVCFECQPSTVNAQVSTTTPTVTLGPIVGSRNPTNAIGSPVALEMFKNEAKVFLLTVVDSVGSVVVLTGKTLRFVVHDNAIPAVGLFDIEAGSIAITGVGNNIANVTVSSAKSNQSEAQYQWELWDVTTAGSEKVLLYGPFTLFKSVQDVA